MFTRPFCFPSRMVRFSFPCNNFESFLMASPGEYEDRKARATVDCSKAIWILATNAFDVTIHEFCKDNEVALFQSDNPATSEKLVKGLCKTLRTESISRFGAPL